MNRQGRLSLPAILSIPVLIGITFALGASGFMDGGDRLDTALYKSLALFGYNDSLATGLPDKDWRLAVGRWTGTAVVFAAAGAAAIALLQERIAMAVARWVKQDLVVIGSQTIANKAFELGLRAGKGVLWLGAASLGARNLRSVAMPWPPGDSAGVVLDHARAADHILIVEDDDAHAVMLARAARRASPRAFITVLMRDGRLAEDAAGTFNESRTRVLSQGDVAARALMLDHPPFLLAREAEHRRIHALIVGFGQVGQAIARDIIVNCRTTYLDVPQITVVDPHAKALEGALRIRAPEIDACVHLNLIEGRIGSEAVEPEADELVAGIRSVGPVTAAYVCLKSDTEALAAAAMLQALMRRNGVSGIPIFVRLRELNTISAGQDDLRGLDSLIPFGDLDSLLAASEFLSDRPDAAARSFSDAYREALPPEERDNPANSASMPWDKLDESFRQNNRDVVAHIPAKLASAGIDPQIWRGVNGVPRLGPGLALFGDDHSLELLAELEHERWCAQRRMTGWRFVDAPRKDQALRLHPDLIPYNDLTDEKKEYDRVNVRETALTLSGRR